MSPSVKWPVIYLSDIDSTVGSRFREKKAAPPPPALVSYFDVVEGLRDQGIQRAMPAVASLLAGSPMSDRSKMVTHVERDTLVFHFAGWA